MPSGCSIRSLTLTSHPHPRPHPNQVRAFTDSTLLMQCIDDLETLYGKHIELWGGLKESALYNQDWLFCWCLQVRMKGRVIFDALLDDVDFPQKKYACKPRYAQVGRGRKV